MKRMIFFLLVPFLFPVATVIAQDGNEPVTYSNLALQFSSQNFNGDAATGYLPTVASSNGYGSFLDNPASVAFIKENSFSFSLFNNNVEYQNTYLGNTVNTSDNSTKLGNIGFVYKVPTEQGSFVMGAGYNRTTNQRVLNRLSARNSESTITDAFREPDSDYYDIAFNTYAIDWGDVDSTYLESIFRIGFEEYPGITQEAEINQSIDIGEYSFFFGTEFQKNFYVGISGGITSGNYTYRRDFLEVDEFNDYNYNFIPSDVSEEGTDIDNILTHDEIDANIVGFDLRAGVIYQVTPKVNVGASYLIPSTLVISESYYSSITTELDDGSTPFQSDFASNGNYEYRVKKPGKLSGGIALTNIGSFDLSVSAELINYSNLRLDFITGNNLDFNEEVELREKQNELHAFMTDNYKLVTNFKTGLGYQLNEQIKLKSGYAYLQGKSEIFEADRNIISGGFSAKVTENILLDVTGQYSFWEDRSKVYSYYDYQDDVGRSEILSQEVQNLKILAGIRFLF